jgi:hypothetical protein
MGGAKNLPFSEKFVEVGMWCCDRDVARNPGVLMV